MSTSDQGTKWGVWITLRTPSGKIVTTQAHDRTVPSGDVLVFDTEREASDYAQKRLEWYERRNTWCEVATGEL